MSWVPQPKRPPTQAELDRMDLEVVKNTMRDYEEGRLHGPQAERSYKWAVELLEEIERRNEEG